MEKGISLSVIIDYCIENHILEDFFRERKSEVIKNMTIDMTYEAREKIFTKAAYEDGREEGIKEGIKEGKLLIAIDLVKDGVYSVEQGAEKAGISVEEFESVMSRM